MSEKFCGRCASIRVTLCKNLRSEREKNREWEISGLWHDKRKMWLNFFYFHTTFGMWFLRRLNHQHHSAIWWRFSLDRGNKITPLHTFHSKFICLYTLLKQTMGANAKSSETNKTHERTKRNQVEKRNGRQLKFS